jgi:hypothetical protein
METGALRSSQGRSAQSDKRKVGCMKAISINWRALRNAVKVLVVCSILLCCAPAHGQSLGRISGIISDSSGGTILGATVTVTDVARGISRTLTTDAAGTYAAPNLIPGTYSVHAVFTGFKAFDRQDIVVPVGGDVHVDVTLQPGEQTQTVTVTGEAPAISTTNAQLESTLAGESLTDLPVAGHQFMQMLGLLPAYHIRPGSNTGPSSMISNGIRGEFTVFSLDGVPDQSNYYLAPPMSTGHPAGGSEQAVLVPVDAVQEFNLLQNAKAETGWQPGAQINLGIKSGANSIHGSAFAAGRNQALTAKNAFATIKPPVAFESYGGSFGGPIMKDKLFYFLAYEGQRFSVGNPRNSNVPSLVPGSTTLAFSPATSIPDSILHLQLNGVAPSPLSLALAGCVVGPPITCTPNKGLFSNDTKSTSFLIVPTSFGGTDNGIAKVDYHLSDKHNLSYSFFEGDGIAVEPVSSVNQGYWSTPMQVHPRVMRAVWTWVPNSTWVNDARFGFDHLLMPTSPSYDCKTKPTDDDPIWTSSPNAPDYAALGFVGGGTVCGFPAVSITGFTGSVLGGATGITDRSTIYRWLDSVSWTHGNHITKFGGEFVLDRGIISLNRNLNKGTLTFNTNTASLNAFATSLAPAGAGSVAVTALDNFMAGKVSSATIQTGTIPREFSQRKVAVYAQDDWRVFPRLTVNLGLRWEYGTTPRESNNLFGNIAIGTTTGIVQQQPGQGVFRMSRDAFAPRFGLAWDITGKGTTVVRTGINVIYSNPFAGTLFVTGLHLVPTGLNLVNGSTTLNQGGTINLATLGINPTSTSLVPWSPNVSVFGNYVGTFASCASSAPCNIGGVVSRMLYPQVINWNFGVQHAITSTLTVDVSYVGTHGQHLLDFGDINQPAPGPSNTAGANSVQSRRPYNTQYPWFGQMKVLGAVLNRSNYNALQIIGRQKMKHGLSFIGSYTWAHALDQNNSEMSPILPQNSLNPEAEYSNASYDLRHRFTFGPTYAIPGKSGYWQMLQGWQLSSTLFVDSGRPMNAVDGANNISGTSNAQDRWALVGNRGDFQGFGKTTPIPCFAASGASSTWTQACTIGLPQACIDAANSLPNGPTGVANNTGILQLNRLGCYMMGNSVIVPPAQGTFGSMARYSIFGVGYWNWDMAVSKEWTIKEKLHTQFRAEFYNVANSVKYALPVATLNTPATFGQSQATPEIGTNSPIIGTGGPRKIQLGLRLEF